jgi:hypothetical protein
MAQVYLSAGNRDHHVRDLLQGSDNARKDLNMDKLREENALLRELVIQLSKLVIRNVVDRQ